MKHMYKIILLIISLIVVVNFCSSQNNINSSIVSKDIKSYKFPELVKKANLLYQKGHFALALSVYEKAHELKPNDANINFKVGLCYYKSLSDKIKALPYLKKSIKNISEKYDNFSIKEEKAPLEALFFLAETFRYTNNVDSALFYYLEYQNSYKTSPPINIKRQINWCANALISRNIKRDVEIVNLGDVINTKFSEQNPVVALNDSLIFFSSNRLREDESNKSKINPVTGEYYNDIYFCRRNKNGSWEQPEFFMQNTFNDEIPLSLSSDYKILILKRKEKGVFNLYKSQFIEDSWSEPEALSEINTSYNETGASLSADGNTLFFVSDRESGYGKSDIYYCTKKENGKWSSAKNLGKVINSEYNEISPFIYPGNKILFFSSDSYQNKGIGGFDIFYSTQNADNTWSKPVSMEYPINTSADNIGYSLAANNKRYTCVLKEDAAFDIFEIKGSTNSDELLEAENEKLVTELAVFDVVETEIDNGSGESEIIEAETITEKETEVVEIMEVETEKIIKDTIEITDVSDIEDMNFQAMDSLKKKQIVESVMTYLSSQLEPGSSMVFKTVYFDYNSSKLLLLSKNELMVLVEFMKKNNNIIVEVVGHTDITGNWDGNLAISGRRAKVVYDFLRKNKIAHNRIIYYGKGSAAPIKTNETEEGRALNRRVEVILIMQ